jgi:hypothetical protein
VPLTAVQPSAYARRQRTYRSRCRTGKAVLSVEIEVVALEELLRDAGLLAPGAGDDRAALESALQRLIAALVADHQRDVSRYA